jgi:hypothetical protein
MTQSYLRIDERNLEVIRRVCTRLYVLTLIALVGMVNYRQFVVEQPRQAYDDVAMLLTLNVIGLLVAVLYFGGVTLPRFRVWPVLGLYVAFVALGFTFTWVKYSVLSGEVVELTRLLGSFYVTSSIIALLMILWGIFAWLGQRRLERELESEDL